MINPNYWLTLTNEKNWRIIKQQEVYAFNDANKKNFDKVKIGDFIVMYVIRKKFGGLFKVINKKMSEKIIFEGDVYNHQIKLKMEFIPEECLNASEKVVNNISIFKDHVRWGTILFGRAIKKITKEDYEFLRKEMEKDGIK